jgi:hypothetical protein
LPKKRMVGQIWFRFGQYHFDNGDFKAARRCFARSIACTPRRSAAYAHWLAAALPTRVRELSRNLVRKVRGTRAKPKMTTQTETHS